MSPTRLVDLTTDPGPALELVPVEPDPPADGYSRWCRHYGVAHAHCPYGCEHPQPWVGQASGRLYCGKCWRDSRKLTRMVPCKPELCD